MENKNISAPINDSQIKKPKDIVRISPRKKQKILQS
jgi:hypothetical protein